MNKRLISLMAAALALLSASGQVTFTGDETHPVIEITPEKSNSSLKKIFVVFNTQDVSMHYSSRTGERAKWYTFDDYPQQIAGVHWDGYKTTLNDVKPNKGYIIEEGTNSYYCWVVNYADYYLELNDLFFINDSPCDLLSFRVDGQGAKIPYKNSIDGPTVYLDRELTLSYYTQVQIDSTYWDKAEEPVIETFESLDDVISIVPPLCNTTFILSGDRFLREWNLEDSVECSDEYITQAVKCASIAVFPDIVDDDGKMEILDGELSDGSAPVHILFTGYPSSAVEYRKWEIATDPDFEDVILQYNQDEVDHTFSDTGTFYVRYMVANADGTCKDYSQTYQITVSESQLGKGARGDIPNVFLPGVQEMWKIPHKSIVEFHCWIYNRWGNLVYEYTDPEGGWDGTYKGRQVDTGVFYSVVTATGSDGVKYKKRGDINILLYNKRGDGTSGGAGDIGN